MFSAIGHEVLRLRRVRIGGLTLGDLPSGQWRPLDEVTIARLTGAPDRSESRAADRESHPR